MSYASTDLTQRTVAAYRRGLATGQHPQDIVGELAATYGVQRPAIWRRLYAGGIPPFRVGRPVGRRQSKLRNVADRVRGPLPPAVERDSCPRCGTRRDIGCKHEPCTLGTVF